LLSYVATLISHCWHERMHSTCMNAAFAVHSPACAQAMHSACLSLHAVALSLFTMPWRSSARFTFRSVLVAAASGVGTSSLTSERASDVYAMPKMM